MKNFLQILTTLVSIGGFVSEVHAHGAPEPPAVLAKREAAIQTNLKALQRCQAKLQRREHVDRRMERRNALIAKHFSKKRDYTPNANLFKRQAAEALGSCALAPEVTIGPYYAPSMLIRDDIREGQSGIKTIVQMEVVDVATCNVVPQVTVDFWQCNSTGVYSGFEVERTQGETWLRGLATTDEDGIAEITTTFPGWYRGRATHIHILAHYNGTVEGDLYKGGKVSHIGQIFFDEATLTEVDNADIYKTNTVARLRNADDFIYRQQMVGFDAVAVTEKLGSKLEDGLLVTTTVGIDLTKDYPTTIGGPGGPGFPGGPGGFPPGTWPGPPPV